MRGFTIPRAQPTARSCTLGLPVVPTFTLSPAGLEETDSPERPVAITVS